MVALARQLRSTKHSTGFSNYNAMFVTLNIRDWHGLSGITNFTWGRALGTAEIGQYNSSNTTLDAGTNKADYGLQNSMSSCLFNSGLAFQPRSFFDSRISGTRRASWVIWSKVGRSLRS